MTVSGTRVTCVRRHGEQVDFDPVRSPLITRWLCPCSSLPYEVSPAEALSHPEVQRRIDVAIVNLRNLTDRVLKAITSNLNKLP